MCMGFVSSVKFSVIVQRGCRFEKSDIHGQISVFDWLDASWRNFQRQPSVCPPVRNLVENILVSQIMPTDDNRNIPKSITASSSVLPSSPFINRSAPVTMNRVQKDLCIHNSQSDHKDWKEHVHNMSSTRDPSPTARPRVERDGFHLLWEYSKTHPIVWDVDMSKHKNAKFQSLTDIHYQKSTSDQVARIAIHRPEVLHAFRPTTIREIQWALEDATDDGQVAVIILTSYSRPYDAKYTPAFCAGGDQQVRLGSAGGYQDGTETASAKLRVLDLQIQMRRCPKPIVAVIRGYAVGGGHILHMVADLTLASDNAIFGQTGPRMGSFDAGYGCTAAVDLMGMKRAKELWFLCRYYSADQALDMGLINAVFKDDELEVGVAQWVRRMAGHSPTALAACKAACQATVDGAAGISVMGGELTRLFYKSPEGQEGHQAYLERRAPHFRSKM